MAWPPDEPPWTREEILAIHERPEAERTPLPQPGERVLFRREDWGEPVPATVLSVQDMEQPLCSNGGTAHVPDVHVWRHPDPAVPAQSWLHPQVRAQLVLRADPWPRVRLELDGGGTAICRESRVRGAPGWLRERTQ